MSQLVLDAGALIAFERAAPAVRSYLAVARRHAFEVTTTSPVVGQVWRDGRRQASLARLLAAVRVDAPDESAARRAGSLLARTRTSDVVDALLVGLARTGDTILTSDPEDLQRLADVAGLDVAIVRV
jgi:predicted nucleic acid-binding protein